METLLKNIRPLLLFLCFFSASVSGTPCPFKLALAAGGDAVRKEIPLDISSFDKVSIKGTLILPANAKGIVIPVHGSFVQTREGDLDSSATWMFPHGAPKRGLFREISGIAEQSEFGSFLYDKRASGKSGGSYADTDMVVLAKDLMTIVSTLRKQYPKLKIGIIGQSEGALTTLKAHDLGMKADFFIFQGGAIESFKETMVFQKTRAAKAFLEDKGPLKEKYPYIWAFYQALYNGDLVQKITMTDEKYYELKTENWSAKTSLTKYRQYFWNGFPLLEQVKVPSLVLYGSEDMNTNPAVVDSIHEGQQKGKFSNIKAIKLKGLEHSFRRINPGETFIDAMGRPIDPSFIKEFQTFLKSISE